MEPAPNGLIAFPVLLEALQVPVDHRAVEEAGLSIGAAFVVNDRLVVSAKVVDVRPCGLSEVELVEEFAKKLVYDGAHELMENEMYILAEQDRRLRRLVGKVDYVLSDAPLLKSAAYVRGVYSSTAYVDHIYRLFDEYNNYNVFVHRAHPYVTLGRVQTEPEAENIDAVLKGLLLQRNIPLHLEVAGDKDAPKRVMENLLLLPPL